MKLSLSKILTLGCLSIIGLTSIGYTDDFGFYSVSEKKNTLSIELPPTNIVKLECYSSYEPSAPIIFEAEVEDNEENGDDQEDRGEFYYVKHHFSKHLPPIPTMMILTFPHHRGSARSLEASDGDSSIPAMACKASRAKGQEGALTFHPLNKEGRGRWTFATSHNNHSNTNSHSHS